MKKILFLLMLLVLSPFANVQAGAAADFMLKDMSGNVHRLSDYQGKWVLVNYWATWCPPCLEEVPDLVNLYDARKDRDLMVLGVVFDYKAVKEVSQYVDDMLMSYPIVLGNKTIETQIGSAEVLPTTYIYDPQGRLVQIKRGLITAAYIEKLMAKGSKPQ